MEEKIMHKILIVDDSKIWREYLKKFLIQKGFTVEEASNGIEGLNKFFEFLPDVVITDYVMPKMNGIHLCRIIRDYPSFKNVGIAILTGADETVNDFWAKKSGANAFFRKSMDINEVLKELDEFIESGKYGIGWSREFFKSIREPFGELTDILEENLKRETLEKEILKLVSYLSDEEHLVQKLYQFLKQFERFDGMYLLLLSASSGRIYGFNKDNKKFSVDYLKSMLISSLKKPITPSEWIFKGGVYDSKSNQKISQNFLAFPIVYETEEEGVILFDNPSNINSMNYLMNLLASSLSVIANALNEFTSYKMQAETDFLTGLYNKKYILFRLGEYLSLAKRKGLPLSLAMLDIDDFKTINDRFGHVAGDEVLKKIGETIKHTVRASDIAGRYGGEEFIIVFPATDLNEAEYVIRRLLDEVRNINWSEILGSDVRITLSAGISCCNYDTTTTKIIEEADGLLYQAKKSGKDRYVKKGDQNETKS
jgi:two-component system cell cycle response regulator